MSAKVLIKSSVGAASFKTTLPNGKDLVVDFNEGNGFTAEVPTEVSFTDDFNTTKVAHKNYAQHLLNSYKFLEIVKVKEAPVVEQPIVKQKGNRKDEKDS